MAIVTRLLTSLFLFAALSLAACSGSNDDGSTHKLASLTDTPLPRGYDLDARNTIVFGEADRWTGKIVYDINSNADDMVEYFRREMPTLGWQEISTFRADTPLLTFQRQGRVANFRITRGRFYGSTVEMVVSPQTGSAAPAGGAGRLRADEQLPPPPPRGPERGVAVEPLK